MNLNYPHIAAQLLDAPLLIHPRKLDNILAAVGPRILGNADWSMMIEGDNVEHRKDRDRGINHTIVDGVAIIPVLGSLVHRGALLMDYSGMTSYQAIDNNLTIVANDPRVHAILLDIDSPGGQVSGAFQLAERIRAISNTKKIVAVASDMAASAGYLLASAASEVVVTKTGGVGSIGVVMAHVDRTAEMQAQGRAVTYIYAGAHKIDGNPYAPLPEGVKADLQAEIDQLYQMFTAHVGAMRGIGQQAAASTEAKMYMGAQAVSQGLADCVGTLETEFQRLRDSVGANRGAGSRRFATRQGVKPMSDLSTGGEPTTPPNPAAGNPTAQTPVLELTTAELDAAKASAFEQGVQAERSRITGITAIGAELCLGDAIVSRMISSGQTLDASRDLMTALKQDIGAQTHINTVHGAGGDAPPPKTAAIDTAAIYAARNGGR